MFLVGQEPRPTMAVLGVRFIQFRSQLGLSTVRRNAQHWTLRRRREQDYAILVPCAAAPIGRVAHDLYRAALGADPLQLAQRKKSNVMAIGRPEWIHRVFRARQSLRRQRT